MQPTFLFLAIDKNNHELDALMCLFPVLLEVYTENRINKKLVFLSLTGY